MDKTKVDDMLIEMITPKVKEIEEKFGNGEGLTQEDINTLLLKSQYNHINHLDKKLDETVDSVKALEGKFTGLEGKFTGLEGKFNSLEQKFETFKSEIRLENEQRFTSMEQKISNLEIKNEQRFASMEQKFAQLEIKVEQGQIKTQETIISTMRWYIGGAGVILVLLKALDIFIPIAK
jgi:predicted nuclease with TOPRIM domain